MNPLDKLISKAKWAIQSGFDPSPALEELKKLADEQNYGGSTTLFGTPSDQEYSNNSLEGVNYGGENNPDFDNERRTGPRDDDGAEKIMAQRALEKENSEIDQEGSNLTTSASSNAPCKHCGNPSDRCVCVGDATVEKIDPQLDPTKKQADLEIIKDFIRKTNALQKTASHIEQIEVPIKDLHLEEDVDYYMTNQKQSVDMLLVNYLKEHVYGLIAPFTIVRTEQEGKKFFVSVLVFDKQLAYGASNAANSKQLHKTTNEQSKNLTKTAWRRRTVEVVGKNDTTGWVACPLEGNFTTRSCVTCPLAGNPETYAKDGFVECHSDDMTNWLQFGNSPKEHRPKDYD